MPDTKAMVPWNGAPADWDQGPVQFRNGTMSLPGEPVDWTHEPVGDPEQSAHLDVVAYTPRAPGEAREGMDGLQRLILARINALETAPRSARKDFAVEELRFIFNRVPIYFRPSARDGECERLNRMERAIRIADTLTGDVPVTSTAMAHIKDAYVALAEARAALSADRSDPSK